MTALATDGQYTLDLVKPEIFELFAAGFATEAETEAEIKRVYEEDGYIEDPHTAVASSVYQRYREQTKDTRPTVIASTASPYKFPRVAVKAVSNQDSGDYFKAVAELHDLSKVAIPKAVDNLDTAPIRHRKVVARDAMQAAVGACLALERPK